MSKKYKNNPNYVINDNVYKRIRSKFESGEFSYGKNLRFEKKWLTEDALSIYEACDFNDELFSAFVESGIFGLLDVPVNYRTNKFYISLFLNKDIYDYIESHIEEFDRDFFKDLITSSEHCTMLSDMNAFLIMPLEYIDEEMCSLAMLHSTWCSASEWFKIVLERKPSVLSDDMWKLGARLYAECSDNKCSYLDCVPAEYKDREFYYELCQCQFCRGIEQRNQKKNIINFVPEEIRMDIAYEIFSLDEKNHCFLSDEMYELPASTFGIKTDDKLWKYLIKKDGNNIKFIPLNMERIIFFTSLYNRHSNEYKKSFRDSISKYICDSNYDTLLPVNSFSKGNNIVGSEQLKLIYNRLGIKIIGKINDLFYSVKLPDGWIVQGNECNFDLLDDEGNKILSFYISNHPCDKEVFITYLIDKIPEKKGTYLVKNN